MTPRRLCVTQASLAASLCSGGSEADLLAAVRTQLAGWTDCPRLQQDLARTRRLYSPPPPVG